MRIIGILALILFTGVFFVLWIDRRWYKRHPGVEEKFADLDEELRKEGR